MKKAFIASVAMVVGIAHAVCTEYHKNYYVAANGNDSGCLGACPPDKPCTLQRDLYAAENDDYDNIIHVLPRIYRISAVPPSYWKVTFLPTTESKTVRAARPTS